MKTKNLAMALPGPQRPETPGPTHFVENGIELEIPLIDQVDSILDVVKKLSKYVYSRYISPDSSAVPVGTQITELSMHAPISILHFGWLFAVCQKSQPLARIDRLPSCAFQQQETTLQFPSRFLHIYCFGHSVRRYVQVLTLKVTSFMASKQPTPMSN